MRMGSGDVGMVIRGAGGAGILLSIDEIVAWMIRCDRGERNDREAEEDVAPPGAIARRRFLAAIPAALGASLAAGAAQEQRLPRVGKATLDCAEKIMGVDFTDAEEEAAAAGVSRNLVAFEQLRKLQHPARHRTGDDAFTRTLPGHRPEGHATPGARSG